MHLFAHDYVILFVVPRALSEVLLSALLLLRAASDNELVNSCNYVFVLVRMRLARELIPILRRPNDIHADCAGVCLVALAR